MKKTMLVLPAIAAFVAIAFYACQTSTAGETEKATYSISEARLIKRGDYLVTAMVCDDCHSPKRMGPNGPEIIPELRLSGFAQNGRLPPVDTNAVKKGWILFSPDLTAAVGPWGASFAANLTSDATGIGNWKEEQFIKAIREGKWKGLEGNRSLLPPMPWQNFRQLKDYDLKAIFAFLKTTRPVNNVVPAPKMLAELQ